MHAPSQVLRGDTYVGADRRGPLAAFVVVAIIAAILLVTSVRSQGAQPSPPGHHAGHSAPSGTLPASPPERG